MHFFFLLIQEDLILKRKNSIETIGREITHAISTKITFNRRHCNNISFGANPNDDWIKYHQDPHCAN